MNKPFRFAAMLLAVVAVVATGCHKENNGDDNGGGNGGNNGGGGNDPTPTVTTYTVTFNANGGNGVMQPQTFTEGETKALTANAFTWENHEFIGWNTTADGTGTVYADGQEITIEDNLTIYAQWMAATGKMNGHYYVDLGLPSGTLWATCNVGADNPIAYGDYFAWGETETKSTYNWGSYKYANGDFDKLTKYCDNASFGDNGFTDTLTILLPEDDAATANWGSGWRMPTQAELRELKDNCTVTWTTQNGVNGRLFTAANGRSIFLPAAGSRWGGSLYDDGSLGYYWSSSLGTDGPNGAWSLYFSSDGYNLYSLYRYRGFSVRPVCASQE